MQSKVRRLFPVAALAVFIGAIVWAVSFKTWEPADFTFVNGTEIKSVDPAIVSGSPEGRIINGLYEGLVNWDPEDLHPVEGVAKTWEISQDGKTYTFHLRENAKWTNRDHTLVSPVTAYDFIYSFRRFLDPLTGAEYAYQLYYVVGAEKYNTGELKPGDPVEIEFKEPPEDGPKYARGKIIKGTFVEREVFVVNLEEIKEAKKKAELEQDKKAKKVKLKKVNLDKVRVEDELRLFKSGKTKDLKKDQFKEYETVKQILVDFDTVGIQALDQHTLQMKLNNSTPFFLSLMGFYPLFPVNQTCVEKYGYPAWTRPENLVTNGPFVLESRRIRDRIRLRKSKTYWDRENVHFNIVDALAIESATTALNLYETGKVDWITAVPSTITPELQKQGRKDFSPATFLGTYYYRINVTRPPMDNPKVRKALNLAIDRQLIVEKITRSGQIPAHSFVHPAIPGYKVVNYEMFDQPISKRIEAARKLLAEAGYADGEGIPKITLLYNTSDDHKKIAEVLQLQWKESLGIDVGLENQEWNSYLNSTKKLKYGLARAGWIGDYVDPNTFLDMFVTDGTNNQTGWGNKKYDQLIKELALQESDPQKRMEYFRQAERILMDELPIMPIYFYVSTSMVRPYVKGFYSNLRDTHPLKGMKIDLEEKNRILRINEN